MMHAMGHGRLAVQPDLGPAFTRNAQIRSERYQNAGLRDKPVHPVCPPRRLMADAGPRVFEGQGCLRQKWNCQDCAPQRPAENLTALNSEAF